MKITFALLCLWVSIGYPALVLAQTKIVDYNPSLEDFANPERGFYHYSATYSGNYEPLDVAEMKSWRDLHQPSGAGYSIYCTLVFRYFFLEDFKSGPISQDYLDAMVQDFEAAREAGVKIIVRFAYTEDPDAGGCSFCPPYSDAPKDIVLQHIAQLEPVLQANADVIAVVQMGFVGIWGEGYYTDFFGDASQPPYGLSAQNWTDRAEVAQALLNVLPPTRCIQVRYAQMKQKCVYGAGAPITSPALTLAEAWQNTPKARIGFHNDCFLASDDDYGTYADYDIGGVGSDTSVLKPYWADDARFVPVGGETCNDWNPYSNCSGQPGGGADTEMERLHYSYLNSEYNNSVNNDWVSGGCIQDIQRRLGYRFVLTQGEYSSSAQPGQTIFVKIDLQNKGFAAPFNPRKVRLLLRHTVDSTIYHVELPDDPRTWLAGGQTYTLEYSLCLPASIPLGDYDLLLHFADPYPTLTERPEYAIRLGNAGGVWEEETGYNRLLHTISINQNANNPACEGELYFSSGTVGLNDYQKGEPVWQVYPNPASSTVYLSHTGCEPGAVWYEFYNSLGQVCGSGHMASSIDSVFQFQLPEGAPGLLFLKVSYAGGQRVFRVMKMRG